MAPTLSSIGDTMDEKRVKDLMVPLDDYGLVDENASLLEAILTLEDAQKKRDPNRQPFRAVLVVDKNRKVIGKLGQLAFLKALEPRRNILGDLSRLSDAGVSDQIISTVMEHYRFFQDKLSDLCHRAKDIKVKEVMHPIAESIDESTSLCEAIFQIIMWNTLSALVTRDGKVVGLLLISDLYQEIADYMKYLSLDNQE
jgi:predicted transcriptional regulator